MCPTSIYVRQDKSMQDHELDKEQVNRHYLPFLCGWAHAAAYVAR